MGRTHSNAFRKVPNFFPELKYEPQLAAVCARNKERAEEFADQWGYESVETDWKKLIARDDIDVIDIAAPNNAPRHRHCRSQGGQGHPLRKASGFELQGRRSHGPRSGESGSGQYGLVQLP